MTPITTYHCLHIPSGMESEEQFTVGYVAGFPYCNRLELLELINKWNAQQPQTWKYWI